MATANRTVNRVNLHYAIQALAMGSGGVFYLVFLLRAGFGPSAVLLVAAAIIAGRLIVRPVVLPFGRRFGMKPALIAGALITGLEYAIVGEVRGPGPVLVLLIAVASIGNVFYWLTYHAYFSVVGDDERRGSQIGTREALAAVVGIVAPLLGAFLLTHVGPKIAFATAGLIEAASAIPLLFCPNAPVPHEATGAWKAARPAMILMALDGWFDAPYIQCWQIALFLSLGERFSAYGGAMALAALVGAAAGIVLGRHIDEGGGRRAVVIAYLVTAAVVAARAASQRSPLLATAANAAGALVPPLLAPAIGAVTYRLAKASPCPFRFQMATEASWDVGCLSGCLVTAGLIALGTPLWATILLALPGLLASGLYLRTHYPAAATLEANAV